MKVPLGVRWFGGVSLCFGVLVILSSSLTGAMPGQAVESWVGGILFGVIPLAYGIGLLSLRFWAYRLLLIYAVGTPLLFFVYMVWRSAFDSGSWYLLSIVLVWSGTVLAYFLRPSVKAQFATVGESVSSQDANTQAH